MTSIIGVRRHFTNFSAPFVATHNNYAAKMSGSRQFRQLSRNFGKCNNASYACSFFPNPRFSLSYSRLFYARKGLPPGPKAFKIRRRKNRSLLLPHLPSAVISPAFSKRRPSIEADIPYADVNPNNWAASRVSRRMADWVQR